jgi:DNA-binding response OmpR family regulator
LRPGVDVVDGGRRTHLTWLRPDFVLLDLDLPDGRDLAGLDRMTAAAQAIPVIALTDGGLTDDVAVVRIARSADLIAARPTCFSAARDWY